MSLPPLFADLPEALQAFWQAEKPWELLGEGLDELLDGLPSAAIEAALSPDAQILGDGIAIGRGTELSRGVVVEGPVWIGRNVRLRPGATVRAGCWIGDDCIVGANTEIKHSVLMPGARAPHLSYVGDSVLGRDVNVGAGVVLSNFRHDGGEVSIPFADERLTTGRRKLGALLGDGVKVGCNAVLSPGVVVGRETQIYAGAVLRAGVYPERSLVKLRQEIEVVPLQS